MALLASQYSIQLRYFECRVANFFNAPEAYCDCNKVIITGVTQQDESPAPLIHTHLHSDQIYHQSNLCFPIAIFSRDVEGARFNYTEPLSKLDADLPDKPPEVIFF
jgi:hypothetical protein